MRTDTTKLTAPFSNVANAPKNINCHLGQGEFVRCEKHNVIQTDHSDAATIKAKYAMLHVGYKL
jgi:hypothetical protein